MTSHKENRYNWFIRVGDMDSFKRQVKNFFNSSEPDYNIAPDRRGFYAFPSKFIEPFLVSSIKDTQPNLANYNKKVIALKKGEEPPYPPKSFEEWETYAEWSTENPFKELPKHKFFLSDGKQIWSHFIDVIPRNEIDLIREAWCLSSVGSWRRAIGKAYVKWYPETAAILCGRISHRRIDFDDFEVFIPAGTIK